MKFKKLFLMSMISLGVVGAATSCDDLFIFTGESGNTIVPFKGTKNSIFFALYNYYGIDGQHFTNKWLGMNDALKEHGIEVTGYQAQKDAKKFKIKRLPSCDLPEDAEIYMVNNQTWDIGLQYTKPLANKKPMAVISTCNGVEFASAPIKASGIGTQNATMGSFCDTYRAAFVDGSLGYLVAKYTTHVAPIFAACVDAVENGQAMKNADGTALSLGVGNWHVTSLEEYDKYSAIDKYKMSETEHPTIMKRNIEKFFDKNSPDYGAEKLAAFMKKSSYEDIKALYEENEGKKDFKREGKKIKGCLICPGSVNDNVQAYIDYLTDYLADVYNVQMLPKESISSQNTQAIACQTAINNGADFVISLQDDTDRNKAIEIANSNKTFFGIVGTCQNPNDYAKVKNLPYYVGSVGTSIEDEKAAGKQMTEYYLDKMIERGVQK